MLRRKQDNGQWLTTRMNIYAFQGHIQRHIEQYAQRVDAYQLSAAFSVSRDVKLAIAEVWKSMPRGFGARMDVPTDV